MKGKKTVVRTPRRATHRLWGLLTTERMKVSTYKPETYNLDDARRMQEETKKLAGVKEEDVRQEKDILITLRDDIERNIKWGYIIVGHLIIEQGMKTIIRGILKKRITPEEKNCLFHIHNIRKLLDWITKLEPGYREIINEYHQDYRHRNSEMFRHIPCSLEDAVEKIQKKHWAARYEPIENNGIQKGAQRLVVEHLHEIAEGVIHCARHATERKGGIIKRLDLCENRMSRREATEIAKRYYRWLAIKEFMREPKNLKRRSVMTRTMQRLMKRQDNDGGYRIEIATAKDFKGQQMFFITEKEKPKKKCYGNLDYLKSQYSNYARYDITDMVNKFNEERERKKMGIAANTLDFIHRRMYVHWWVGG